MRSLADSLEQNGRPMSYTAISQVENKQRRVDSDELAILAAELDISIATLLTPRNENPEEEIGSAVAPNDTAKAVVNRVYGRVDFLPAWIQESIENAIGAKWRFMMEAARYATELSKNDGDPVKTLRAIVDDLRLYSKNSEHGEH